MLAPNAAAAGDNSAIAFNPATNRYVNNGQPTGMMATAASQQLFDRFYGNSNTSAAMAAAAAAMASVYYPSPYYAPTSSASPADVKPEFVDSASSAASNTNTTFKPASPFEWAIDQKRYPSITGGTANNFIPQISSNSASNAALEANSTYYPAAPLLDQTASDTLIASNCFGYGSNPYYVGSNRNLLASNFPSSTELEIPPYIASTAYCNGTFPLQPNSSTQPEWKPLVMPTCKPDHMGGQSSSFSASFRTAARLSRASQPSVPYRTGPGTNNVRVRTSDKYRTVYSERQRLELEQEFRMNEFITADRKADLSTRLQLTERQIKIWFQNRRAKNRKTDASRRLTG
ncbi:homeobox domain-containing protein [Ditylenchus destructor]|nr:homeobox domain-containing protein [Ditylenchus destructor]